MIGSTSKSAHKRNATLAFWRIGGSIEVASAMLLLLLWLAATLVLPPSVAPAPTRVVALLAQDITNPVFWSHVGATSGRIAAAFSLAMAIATGLGIAMGFSGTARRFFKVWLTVLLMTPSLVVIIFAYMLFGLNETAALIGTTATVVAIITINIEGSVRALDRKLIEMSRSIGLKRRHIVLSIVLPQLMPPIVSSARFGLGLVWKMVLFVELLGRSNGIGYQIEFFYQQFNMERVLQYALFFILIMLIIEVFIFGQIEKYLFRWRTPDTVQ